MEIVIWVLLVLLFFSFLSFFVRKAIEKRKQGTVEDIDTLNNHYSKMIQSGYDKRSIRHDMKKQLTILQALPEDAGLQEILDEIIRVYHKKTEILHIDFICDRDSVEGLMMDKLDFISMILNLLDNAIEACELVEKSAYMHLYIKRKDGGICIRLENAKEENVHPLINGEPATTKENKMIHGIGSRIVKNVVEKYNGRIHYTDSGNEFITEVTI
ncbi:MAG: GHKL domain-containing protein [Lachnospiraceae bacterium]